MIERPTLASEVEALLNRYGAEHPSNTPDYLLAEYLMSCLRAANTLIVSREKWYGRGDCGDAKPGQLPTVPDQVK